MKALPFLLPLTLFAAAFTVSVAVAGNDYDSLGLPPIPIPFAFPNAYLRDAYVFFQYWKRHGILSDPFNFTASWSGPAVCSSYLGVYCAPLPGDDQSNHPLTVVAGIDLNHADIAGHLPRSLPFLLPHLALIHLNSNRFCGTLPSSFSRLRLLHELDISNNRFVGKFPRAVLAMPALKYLDLRFNEFEGAVPPELFDRPLDAIFINHNRFQFEIPHNFGNSPVSVIVLSGNKFTGCLPASIGNMSGTLNEVIFSDNGLSSCVPDEIGLLSELTVLDVSFNALVGPLPLSVAKMRSLEQLDVAHNRLSGQIPAGICDLPRLENFTFSYNFFTGEPPACLRLPAFRDRRNCLAGRQDQRSPERCRAELATPVDCSSFGCKRFLPLSPPISSPPPPTHSPPPPSPRLEKPPPLPPQFSPPALPTYHYQSPPPPASPPPPLHQVSPPSPPPPTN